MTSTWDTWSVMRARTWDLGDVTLPDVLALLGAADVPLPQQQAVLRDWMASPAYIPAPEYLKNAARLFLERAAPPPPEPVPVPQQQAKWQAKLDGMFPGGAIATWDADKTVPVSWIRVVGASGLDPVLAFYHPFGWVKDSKVLASLETVQTKPHLIALATFTDGSACQLTAAIPDGLAESLAKDRADVIAGNVPVSPA